MIIDGHSHVTFPIENDIRQMDEALVDKTILFSTVFHPENAATFQEVKQSMAYLHELLAGQQNSIIEIRKRAVAELVDAIQQYPDRYIGFGSVPTGLPLKETLTFVQTHIVNNDLAGMGEFTPASGSIQQLDNIFEASKTFNNLPIWIHAFFPLTFEDITEIYELAKKFPKTPVILGHLGGFHWLKTIDLVKSVTNLYLDTSAYYSTFVLEAIINEIPDKCLFGVDRPFGNLKISKETILQLAHTQSIADAVLGENMARLLHI